jgi:hypothetical protein
MTVVPSANSAKMAARWLIDLSPGGRHLPRTARAG